jgi:hypothetical protein
VVQFPISRREQVCEIRKPAGPRHTTIVLDLHPRLVVTTYMVVRLRDSVQHTAYLHPIPRDCRPFLEHYSVRLPLGHFYEMTKHHRAERFSILAGKPFHPERSISCVEPIPSSVFSCLRNAKQMRSSYDKYQRLDVAHISPSNETPPPWVTINGLPSAKQQIVCIYRQNPKRHFGVREVLHQCYAHNHLSV